jgi:hypothetical protein
MKNLRTMMFALTVLLFATATQAQQTNVKASVPFDFVVGNHTYPAGDYSIKSINDAGSSILVRNAQDNSIASLQMSSTCANAAPSRTTKLVFLRMSDSYFLSQVWVAGNSAGREFPKSKAQTQLAQNHEKPERVIVAANLSK